jgi:hypothetical protein
MRPAALRVTNDPAFRRRILAWLAVLWLVRTGIRLGIRAARRPGHDRGADVRDRDDVRASTDAPVIDLSERPVSPSAVRRPD